MYRSERVGDQLRSEIAELLMHEIKEPSIGFVTVTEVQMSRDLRVAKVYVSVMGDAESRAATMAGLERASGYLRRQVGRRMRLRLVPELRFLVDDTLDRTERLDELLRLDPPAALEVDLENEETTMADGLHGGVEAVADWLRDHDDFAIASHIDPDGDSLGSSLGLALGLRQLGKSARVVISQPLPPTYQWLPCVDQVESAEEVPGESKAAILIECSDFARSGLGGYEGLPTLNVDHHAKNAVYADLNWIDASLAANGIMIGRLLRELGCEVTPDIAQLLFIAVFTDTGSFRHANSDATALRFGADMVEAGANSETVVAELYGRTQREKVALLADALASLEFSDDGRVAWMSIGRATFAKHGDTADTEGFINHAQTVEGVVVSFLFKEVEEGEHRVSMRSDGQVDVADLAAEFGGGGHRRAAGCSMQGAFADVHAAVVNAVLLRLGAIGPTE